ncbi:MAG: GNAT family N-acetyltransferase [Aeromonadaceae bacterium]|nr:GNAT family N-acetyltransferase [Aeromonadaceae bacterium]
MDFTPATPAHYAGIAALIPDAQALYLVHPAGHFPWDAEQLARLAQERSHLTVGLLDGQVQAFANLYQLVPGRSAFLGNVVVAQACRGQGLGAALVQHMLGICDGLGVQPTCRCLPATAGRSCCTASWDLCPMRWRPGAIWRGSGRP